MTEHMRGRERNDERRSAVRCGALASVGVHERVYRARCTEVFC